VKERGSVTFWGLGLTMMILLLGLLAVDLWRILGWRRELTALTDAASVAAAAGIDEAVWRAEGNVVLDPVLARERAEFSLAAQPAASDIVAFSVVVAVDGSEVVVTASRLVEFGVLGLLSLQAEPELMTVTATAEPRVSP